MHYEVNDSLIGIVRNRIDFEELRLALGAPLYSIQRLVSIDNLTKLNIGRSNDVVYGDSKRRKVN